MTDEATAIKIVAPDLATGVRASWIPRDAALNPTSVHGWLVSSQLAPVLELSQLGCLSCVPFGVDGKLMRVTDECESEVSELCTCRWWSVHLGRRGINDVSCSVSSVRDGFSRMLHPVVFIGDGAVRIGWCVEFIDWRRMARLDLPEEP